MSVRPDDLVPGLRVMVVRHDYLSSEEDGDEWRESKSPYPLNGIPWEVKAISLPFIIASVGNLTTTLDVRRMDLQRATKEYCAYYDRILPHDRSFSHCPNCSHLMLPVESTTIEWSVKMARQLACPNCTFIGGVPCGTHEDTEE